MNYTKLLTILVLSLVIGFLGCKKEEKKEVGSIPERVEKNLVPPKAEVKGPNFSVGLDNLKVVTYVDPVSKELAETPKLNGDIKIINKSKDIMDIQAITLEYLDGSGKPIPFKSGEKVAKVTAYWQAIKPEGTFQGSLETTIPRTAIKEKALSKIEITVVYVPSPLKRETLTLPEKLE
jgi:hypothetical protein